MKKIIKLTESDLKRIVLRVISEQENNQEQTAQAPVSAQEISSEVGSEVDPNVVDEVMSCSFDELGSGLQLKPEAKKLLDSVKTKIKEMISAKDRAGLKRSFRHLKNRLKNIGSKQEEEVNEQAALAGTFVLLGISAPLWAWVAIGGIVLILLIKAIISLSSWIPKKRGRGCSRTITYRVR